MNHVIFKISIVLFASVWFNTYGQTTTLTDQEINDMKFMLEEEKMAYDVYAFLDEKWNLMIFNNIKQSEQQHTDMMEDLLNANKIAYKLSDVQGVFYNEDIQNMYYDLIEKGSKSAYDALQAGKTIEITDINDLEKAIKATSDSYITDVYSRLMFASKNHLRAFNRNLSRFN